MTDIANLAGIFPPLTTPFDADGEVDYGALAANVERYNETGLAGYLAFGSNGEAVHLTAEERRRVLKTLREKAAPGKTLLAGVNELSNRAAVAAVREAGDAGADAVLLITPYFYKGAMKQDLLRAFFAEVAAASPVPVLLYNVPANTGVVLEPATISALADEADVVGVKDSAGNFSALAATVRLAPPGFRVLVGNAGILYPALSVGAVGAILAIACAAPEATVELYEAVRAGEHERARELQQNLAPVAAMVTSGLGVAGLKAALDVVGYVGGVPRRPLLPISDEQRAKLVAWMGASGVFPSLVP